MSPRASSWRSSSASSYLPCRISRLTLRMEKRTTRFSSPIRYRNVPEMEVPMMPVQWCSADVLFCTAPLSARIPKFRRTARTKTMVE